MEKDKTQHSTVQDISIAISLIITGIVLLFIPNYFRNDFFTSATSYLLIIFGMFAVGTEINKLNKNQTKFGLDDFAIGVLFIVTWIWIYSSFDNIFTNVATLFVLFFGIAFSISGVIQFTIGIFQSEGKKNLVTKVTLTLINVLTALTVLYETLQKFGVIDSLAK